MFPITEQYILTEFKENVVQHVSLLLSNTSDDVHTVLCEFLESKVLGVVPGLDADTLHLGKIS